MTKKIFENLLIGLTEKQISEYYLTPGSYPFYRLDGVLHKDADETMTTSASTEEIMGALLLEKEEQQFYEVGSYELAYSMDKVGRFRVRFGRQRSSITVVILVKNTMIPDVETLQIPEVIRQNMRREQGLMIFCGEKKSHKLTTIAALIKEVSESHVTIISTTENPIEYLLPHGKGIVNQMEVGIDIQDMIMGLNESVNNNSDLIYLSDMSSVDEIRQVLVALEKGFFVIVSMNVTSVEAAINHLLYGFDKNEQIHVKRLLANHLVSIVFELNIKGVTGSLESIYEVLLNNTSVQNMFLENKMSQLDELFEAFPGSGMISMEEAMIQAVTSGRITKEEAVAIAKRPGNLLKKLNGVNK